MNKQQVWGLPLRAFHWSLVILVGISFYTGKFGDFDSIDTHMQAGYGILGLLIFRILFGLAPTDTARFSNFLRGPRAIRDYVRQPRPTMGHNPLGALGVVALLVSLTVQVTTGLFATDDIFVEGPLNHLVSDDTSGWLTGIHNTNQWVLLSLIGLHLAALVFHEWRLKERLILPMLTGKKHITVEAGESPAGSRNYFGWASACALVSVTLAYVIVNKI